MIYITQLIYVKEGQEETFLAFEDFAIPLMEKYDGQILYRIRPTEENFIALEANKATPYEIHFISFPSDQALTAFMQDENRLHFVHLKEKSVQSTLLIKGQKM